MTSGQSHQQKRCPFLLNINIFICIILLSGFVSHSFLSKCSFDFLSDGLVIINIHGKQTWVLVIKHARSVVRIVAVLRATGLVFSMEDLHLVTSIPGHLTMVTDYLSEASIWGRNWLWCLQTCLWSVSQGCVALKMIDFISVEIISFLLAFRWDEEIIIIAVQLDIVLSGNCSTFFMDNDL